MECSSQRYCFPATCVVATDCEIQLIWSWLIFKFQPLAPDMYVLFVWLQGGWETDESMEEAALRETMEEAGVVGNIQVSIYNDVLARVLPNIAPLFLNSYLLLLHVFLQSKLGKWVYKSKRQGTVHEGYMFSLLVKKQLENWPEKNFRKRRWVSVWQFILFFFFPPISKLGNFYFDGVLKV